MLFGIFETYQDRGDETKLIAHFTTPLTILSVHREGNTAGMNFARIRADIFTQRWEIEANFAPVSTNDTLVRQFLAMSKFRVLTLRAPQSYDIMQKNDANSYCTLLYERIAGTPQAQKSSTWVYYDRAAVANNGSVSVGQFFNFTGPRNTTDQIRDKLFLCTELSGDQLHFWPPLPYDLPAEVGSGASATYRLTSQKHTVMRAYMPEELATLYSLGTLMGPGSVTFAEANPPAPIGDPQ